MNNQYLPRTQKATEKAGLQRGGVDFVTSEFANLLERQLTQPLPNPSADEEVETPLVDAAFAEYPVMDTQRGGDAITIQAARAIEKQLRQQHNAEREEQRKRDVADDSIVASCNCLTKTNEVLHHAPGCKYRLIVERDVARSELATAQREIEQLKQKTAL